MLIIHIYTMYMYSSKNIFTFTCTCITVYKGPYVLYIHTHSVFPILKSNILRDIPALQVTVCDEYDYLIMYNHGLSCVMNDITGMFYSSSVIMFIVIGGLQSNWESALDSS